MTNEGHPADPVDDEGRRSDVAPHLSNDTMAPTADAPRDGHRAQSESSGLAAATIPGLGDVEWQTSYDRESVDRFVAEIETEKARLTEEIAAAQAREASARERLATQQAYNEMQLGALVVSARTELDRIEKQHVDAVTAIRAEALEKAAEILGAARREASAVGDASASLSRVVSSDSEDVGDRVSSVVDDAPEPDSEERTDVG